MIQQRNEELKREKSDALQETSWLQKKNEELRGKDAALQAAPKTEDLDALRLRLAHISVRMLPGGQQGHTDLGTESGLK